MIEATTAKELKSTNFDRKFFQAKIMPNTKVPVIFIPA
jgi:hypothetical protein